MKRSIWVILIILIVVAFLTVFWLNNNLPSMVPPDFAAPEIPPLNQNYLPFVQLDWRDENESKIFLLHAEARYGYYKFQTIDGWIQRGDPCLIINVTIRNDYNETYLPPIRELNQSPYNFSRYGYYIYLNALLFDSSGSVGFRTMAVADQNSISLGSYNTAVIRVDSNQTKNFDIYIASDNRDISRFELAVYDVGGQEMPTSSP